MFILSFLHKYIVESNLFEIITENQEENQNPLYTGKAIQDKKITGNIGLNCLTPQSVNGTPCYLIPPPQAMS